MMAKMDIDNDSLSEAGHLEKPDSHFHTTGLSARSVPANIMEFKIRKLNKLLVFTSCYSKLVQNKNL